jgi:hypothetical protein
MVRRHGKARAGMAKTRQRAAEGATDAVMTEASTGGRSPRTPHPVARRAGDKRRIRPPAPGDRIRMTVCQPCLTNCLQTAVSQLSKKPYTVGGGLPQSAVPPHPGPRSRPTRHRHSSQRSVPRVQRRGRCPTGATDVGVPESGTFSRPMRHSLHDRSRQGNPPESAENQSSDSPWPAPRRTTRSPDAL